MSSSFSFNEREFRRMVEQEAQDGINDLARNWTRELDALRTRLAGHPVDEIKPHLQAVFSRDGGSVTDPELSEWAQMIADDVHIEFSPEKIRW
jgi:hypothetical protein